jgi:hypothetical protein
VLLWVTVERGRTINGPGLELKVEPSPSTRTDGIRFAVEEFFHHQVRLLTGARALPRTGHRVVRSARKLRLCVEIWR